MTSNKRKKEQKHIRRLMMLPVLLIYKLHFANGAQRAMINNKIRQDRNRQQTHLPSTVSLPRKRALNGKLGEWSACLTWALVIVFQMFFFPYHGVKRKFTSATIIILYLYIFHMNPNVFLLNYECGYKHQSISCCDAPTHPDLSKQDLTTGRCLSKKTPSLWLLMCICVFCNLSTRCYWAACALSGFTHFVDNENLLSTK